MSYWRGQNTWENEDWMMHDEIKSIQVVYESWSRNSRITVVRLRTFCNQVNALNNSPTNFTPMYKLVYFPIFYRLCKFQKDRLKNKRVDFQSSNSPNFVPVSRSMVPVVRLPQDGPPMTVHHGNEKKWIPALNPQIPRILSPWVGQLSPWVRLRFFWKIFKVPRTVTVHHGDGFEKPKFNPGKDFEKKK